MSRLQLHLTIVLFIVNLTVFAQTVRIADNNASAPSGSNIYPTLQAAADAADPGDIIYVQPSPTTYGNLTVTKELHIKGIGFNLEKDLPHQSNMGIVHLWNNTDNTSNSSNSTVTGVTLGSIRIGHGNGGSYTLDNVKIHNCTFITANYAITSNAFDINTFVPVSNLEIYGCEILGRIQFHTNVVGLLIRNNLLRHNIELNGTNTNQTAIITNNIIYGGIRKDAEGDAVIIQHNNFLGANGVNFTFVNPVRGAIIANNIFYGRTPSTGAAGTSTSTSFHSNVFTNNLSYETGNDELPPAGGAVGNTGDGNIVAASPLFENAPVVNSWDVTREFTLEAGSPAINAGSDGTDIGITGGIYPFVEPNFISKTTPIPTIQIFNTDAIINPGDNLDVRIQIKAN